MVDILLAGLVVSFIIIFVYLAKQKVDDESGAVVPYLLDDANFERRVDGEFKDRRIENWCSKGGKYLGHAIINGPREAQVSMNPTTPPGGTDAILISLVFQLGKWEWLGRVKFDEWIEVSPTFAQYYQITLKQKEELEARIKSGLASAAQAVADLELLKHDQRKYREFLDYFGYALNEKTGEWKKTGTRDEHALRAVFIDQVDAHTGEGIAIRSIVQRWPTLIVDFMKLADKDMDVDKIKTDLDVSKAEAVVLSTKNRIFVEWKRLFEPEIKARYERIEELVKSRQESVKSYRDWLKPIIARHKMLNEGLSSAGGRAKTISSPPFSTLLTIGRAMAISNTKYWSWRHMPLPELEKGGTERLAVEVTEKRVEPDDEWTRKNLIFHPKHGLIRKHAWITDEWVAEKKRVAISNDWIRPNVLYYAFIEVDFIKSNLRTAGGDEVEDTIFDLNGLFFSKNVLFVKLLEMFAKQEEFNRYVEDLIGIREYAPGTEREVKMPVPKEEKKARFGKISSGMSAVKSTAGRFADFFSLPFGFFKHGPYERDFDERLTKYWLRDMAQRRFEPVVKFVKDKMGYGIS
ncbi:MAG: hypothetical protein HYT72_02595 [Candidatus Aenigmarchaeota archaeon]|nr:hypothetical protein [Candidatus Aenigmarchaeota archaeon]